MKTVGVDSRPDTSWTMLRPGQPVRFQHERGEHIYGVLDTQTEDCSVIWVHQSDGAGRRLIHRDDGFRLEG